MDVIYLDQNRFSELAKLRLGKLGPKADEKSITEVHQRLTTLVASGRAICPYSEYHVHETVKYDNDEAREAVCKVVGDFSLGRCFRHPRDRMIDELWDLYEQEYLNHAASSPRASALGFGIDCFPFPAVNEETETFVGSLPTREVFRTIVENLRRDGVYRARVATNIDEMLAAEWRANELRAAKPLLLPEARKAESEAMLATPEIRELIQAIAEGTGIDPDDFLSRVQANKLKNFPTLAAMVELRARRDTDPDMKPDPGDPLDAAHLSALGHVRIFAADGRGAELAKTAATMLNVKLVASPAALVSALEGAYPTALAQHPLTTAARRR